MLAMLFGISAPEIPAVSASLLSRAANAAGGGMNDGHKNSLGAQDLPSGMEPFALLTTV